MGRKILMLCAIGSIMVFTLYCGSSDNKDLYFADSNIRYTKKVINEYMKRTGVLPEEGNWEGQMRQDFLKHPVSDYAQENAKPIKNTRPPNDPFNQSKDQWEFVNYGRSTMDAPRKIWGSHLGYFLIDRRGYVLVSLGPDRDLDYDEKKIHLLEQYENDMALNDDLTKQLKTMAYDPSNGTRSSGDLFSWAFVE